MKIENFRVGDQVRRVKPSKKKDRSFLGQVVRILALDIRAIEVLIEDPSFGEMTFKLPREEWEEGWNLVKRGDL